MRKTFYGWWVTIAAFLTFGISVGIPYYNLPFFYDYFKRAFGWSRADITFGLPLAAIVTIWVGPILIPRFKPRKLILVGTALTAVSLFAFTRMGPSILIYWGLWVVYLTGYIFSGPIPHQLIVSHWFKRNRGKAMGLLYVGVGLIGSLGSFVVRPLTEWLGFRGALAVLGGIMFLAWPLVFGIIRDKPSDIGQNPDGDAKPPAEESVQSETFAALLKSYPFWLLLIGSFCSIGAIGSVNLHMKFIFLDHGFTPGRGGTGDRVWQVASITILWSSIGGRLAIGYLADRFSKKWVMFATYFVVAITIPLLLAVHPGREFYLYSFSLLFGFGMGADYMMIPLMAADQFGVNSLARAMAVILPVNTIGQTWFPYFVSLLRDRFGSYQIAMGAVLGAALAGAIAIAALPRLNKIDETLRLQKAQRAAR